MRNPGQRSFLGKTAKKNQRRTFQLKTSGTHRYLRESPKNSGKQPFLLTFYQIFQYLKIFVLVECCTFFEFAIALFQKIAGDLVFSLIPILFIESSTSPLAISLMELRRIQFSVKLSKQKKKKEKM